MKVNLFGFFCHAGSTTIFIFTLLHSSVCHFIETRSHSFSLQLSVNADEPMFLVFAFPLLFNV